MRKRLVPTGYCWCGCRTVLDLGSFFAPGHDKKAESKVIMEQFGGVPQFLKAFGYAPDAEEDGGDASWLDTALRMRDMNPALRQRVALEYVNPADRNGSLQRTKFNVIRNDFGLDDGAVPFILGNAQIWVPFVDVLALYKTGSNEGHGLFVARLAGSVKFEGDRVTYVAYGREEPVLTTRALLRHRELGPLKTELMAAWQRVIVDKGPAFWVASNSNEQMDGWRGFKRSSAFADAVAMLSLDDATLKQRCVEFEEACSAYDQCWNVARRNEAQYSHLEAPPNDRVFDRFLSGEWNLGVGGRGVRLVDSMKLAYEQLSRHIDSVAG